MLDLTGYRVEINIGERHFTIRGKAVYHDCDCIIIDREISTYANNKHKRVLITSNNMRAVFIVEKPAEDKYCLWCGVSREILEKSINKE